MRIVRPIVLGVAILTAAAPAWAQAITATDLTRLETVAGGIEVRAEEVRKTNPVLAQSIEKSLADLRDDIAYLKVKLRRDGSITTAEFTDVRNRLDALRNQMPASPGVDAPSAPATKRLLPSWTGHGFVNVSGGMQFGNQTATANFTFPLYDETATVTTTRTVKGGLLLDVTGGVHISGQWGIGFSFYTRSSNGSGAVSSSLPDPLAFDSPRLVNGTIAKMTHKEVWLAPLFVYVMPLSDKLDVTLLIGPALAKLTHDLPTDATVTEPASGPQVAVTVTSLKKSYLTFEVAGDVRYALTESLGVGGFVRFGQTPAHLSSTIKLTLGGVQVGGGVRLRF